MELKTWRHCQEEYPDIMVGVDLFIIPHSYRKNIYFLDITSLFPCYNSNFAVTLLISNVRQEMSMRIVPRKRKRILKNCCKKSRAPLIFV